MAKSSDYPRGARGLATLAGALVWIAGAEARAAADVSSELAPEIAAPAGPEAVASPEAPAVPEAAPAEVAAPGPETVATPPTAAPSASEVPAPAPVPTAPAQPATVEPTLLDAGTTTAPAPTRRPAPVEDPDAHEEALRKAYTSQFRPANNPVRLNIAARALFANIGGGEEVGGRMGGAAIDIGPAWNRFAPALSLTGFGGSVLLPRKTGAELNGLIGAGLTLSLGRLALVGRGFLDFRVGYDLYYGIVNQRRDGQTVIVTSSQSNVVLTQTENLLPHGPRARLDLGLLLERGRSKYFHGLGASLGWQGLIGSIRGELPYTNMLTIGLAYWMG